MCRVELGNTDSVESRILHCSRKFKYCFGKSMMHFKVFSVIEQNFNYMYQ